MAQQSTEGSMRWKRGQFQITLSDWLETRAFEQGLESDDICFDDLIGPWNEITDSADLVRYCCGLLRQVTAAVQTQSNLQGTRHVIVALPLRLSKQIRRWKGRYWRHAGMRHEPPALILTKDDRFIERFDEEYWRALELPIDSCPEVQCVYKSYHDLSGPSSRDVGNTIFLVSAIKHAEP